MSHESLFIMPHPVVSKETVSAPIVEHPAPPEYTHALVADPEQARAVEALFAGRDPESDTVAGLLGMWTGAMILRDLALETHSPPASEVEAEEDKPHDEPA